MQAGKLDRTIAFERKVKAPPTPTGGVAVTWTQIATVRAEIVKRSASELPTGFGEAEAGSVTFLIRYLGGITTADRIVFDGRPYDLKEITEIGRRRGFELRAVATS